MKIIGKVTKRSLLYNKRRTMLTAVGLMLAVSLLTAIAVFVGSLLNTYRESYRLQNGNWIATITSEAGARDFSSLNPDDVFWVQSQGTSEFQLDDLHKNYLEWMSLKREDFKESRFKLEKGRMPAQEGEVLVDYEWAVAEGWLDKLEKTIAIPVGTMVEQKRDTLNASDEEKPPLSLENLKTREFKIVGFVKGLSRYLSRRAHSVALVYSDQWDATGPMTAYLNWDNPKASTLQALENSVGKDHLMLNRGLLEAYFVRGFFRHNSLGGTLIGLTYIVLFLVMLPIVAIFSNAFGISLTERVRHMGMLASVGATKRQLRQSVFLEALSLALIGILPGILLGILGIGITLAIIGGWTKDMFGSAPLRMHIEAFWIASSIFFSLVMVFLASLYPAWRAGRTTPLQAIRSQNDIKLTQREVKISPRFKKFFGIEGALALKNIKRNRRSFRFTLFSLVCSIIVFVGSASLMDHIQAGIEVGLVRTDYNVEVTMYRKDAQELIRQIAAISKTEPKEQVYHGIYSYDYVVSKKEGGDPESDVTIPIVVMPDAALEKAGIPKEAFQGPGLKLWLNDLAYTMQSDDKYVEKRNYFQESEIKDFRFIYSKMEEEGKSATSYPVEVVGYSQKTLEFANEPKNYVFFVMPESKIKELQAIENPRINANYIGRINFLSEKDQALEKSLEEAFSNQSDHREQDYSLTNLSKRYRSIMTTYRFASVLLYGMLVLMTLTALTNGYNAILTFYTLRQREFSVLRSLGMAEKSFRRMIRFESIFYGFRALLWGIPISLGLAVVIWRIVVGSLDVSLVIPWRALLITIVAISLFVWVIMQMAWRRIRKLSIVENIRKEVI